MSGDWRASIAGERMAVDGEFTDRIAASSLSPQQWSLVMTAVSFEIEDPDDPDEARLVANTDSLPAIADELDRIEQSGPGAPRSQRRSGGGLLSRIFGAFGGGTDDGRLDEATALADEYARRLQEKLRERGRWERVCSSAASE